MDLPPLETVPGLPLPLLRGEEHPCPYLPDRQASELYLLTNQVDADLYQRLMDHGFRRSSDVFYVPSCASCQACVPIRVLVDAFQPSRSQKRAWRRNQDLEVTFGPVSDDDEHWDVYQRYQLDQHAGAMLDTRSNFSAFLCRSPLETMELTLRKDGRLVGAGIVDVCPDALSSVYFYFAPEEKRRSLGTFSALLEVEQCRQLGKPYWYLGYWVAGCQKMDYKQQFQPHELWNREQGWHAGDTRG